MSEEKKDDGYTLKSLVGYEAISLFQLFSAVIERFRLSYSLRSGKDPILVNSSDISKFLEEEVYTSLLAYEFSKEDISLIFYFWQDKNGISFDDSGNDYTPSFFKEKAVSLFRALNSLKIEVVPSFKTYVFEEAFEKLLNTTNPNLIELRTVLALTRIEIEKKEAKNG